MSNYIYVLPAELTIYEVEETYSELNASLQEHDDVQLDAQHVVEIDSAGFQLLMWFVLQQRSQTNEVKLLNPAPAVSTYLTLFGIETLSV